MSEIVGHDTWEGLVTRVYVWYPTREAGRDWRNDPALQHVLTPMAQPRSYDDPQRRYYLDGAPYYWDKYATGCVWVIARTEGVA